MISRRRFLSMIGVGVGAVSLPLPPVATEPVMPALIKGLPAMTLAEAQRLLAEHVAQDAEWMRTMREALAEALDEMVQFHYGKDARLTWTEERFSRLPVGFSVQESLLPPDLELE